VTRGKLLLDLITTTAHKHDPYDDNGVVFTTCQGRMREGYAAGERVSACVPSLLFCDF
jgi:hypothetical protein